MNVAYQRDIGANLVVKAGVVQHAVNLATATTYSGAAIDRRGLGHVSLSAKVAIPYKSLTISTTGGWSAAWHLQHSSVSSAGWANTTDRDSNSTHTITVAGTTAATTATSEDVGDWEIGELKRFIRMHVVVTQTASSTTTEYLDLGGSVVIGGAALLPAATTAV